MHARQFTGATHAGHDWPASTVRVAITALLAVGMLTVACSGGGGELDPYLCTLDDLGGGYQQLTTGNFSPRDLADLGPDAKDREREFRNAGMERGRFVFFKQALPKPPFDPPLNVVCQVLEFRSEEEAQQWIVDLHDPGLLATSVVAWLPADHRDGFWTQLNLADGIIIPESYGMRAGSGDTKVEARGVARVQGRFVASVTVGTAGPNPDGATVATALASMETRGLCRRQGNSVTPAACPGGETKPVP